MMVNDADDADGDDMATMSPEQIEPRHKSAVVKKPTPRKSGWGGSELSEVSCDWRFQPLDLHLAPLISWLLLEMFRKSCGFRTAALLSKQSSGHSLQHRQQKQNSAIANGEVPEKVPSS